LFPNCEGQKGHYERRKSYGPASLNKKSNKTPAIRPLKKPQTKKSHEPKKPLKNSQTKKTGKKSQTKKIGKKK
jgi:hypothetical protein